MNDLCSRLLIALRWFVFLSAGWTFMPGLSAGAGDLAVASGNGLTVVISPSGSVSGVEIGGERVEGGRTGGFFLGLGAAKEAPRAAAEASGNGVRLRLVWPGKAISGTALITGNALGVTVHGEVSDASRKDRAITISLELPVGPKAAATWWEDIDRSRPVSGSAVFENVVKTPAGATGTHSPYPLACVSGSSAVAMGIPLDKPVVHRFGYSSSTGRLSVSFDFALTPVAERLPSSAAFDVVIYPVDPLWGFRSALERYYTIYPASFERRVPKMGAWVCWGNVESVPGFSDYGFQYHWAPDSPAAAAFDSANKIYAFLYSDSARFFSDLGTFSRQPGRAEATGAIRGLLQSADSRGVILGRPQSATGRLRFEAMQRELGAEKASEWLRKALAAARISATTDAAGEYNVGYILNRKDWGPENWWTGRLLCDVDPDIPGGYGGFLLDDLFDRALPGARAKGGAYNGVALDNYFVDADTLDYSQEHVAISRIPLTFSHENLRPVVPGDFAMYRWVSELSRRLRAQGGWVMANTCSFPYPFAASDLDIHGYEWNLMDLAPLARALAYHKPVVSLPVKEEHYQEAFLRKHVRFGFVPGGYANERFATDTTLRALYKRYVPALLRCAEAGWEPVTEVVSENAAVRIERFGRPGSPMFLSITNVAPSAQLARIRLDVKRLGLSLRASRTTDLISGRNVELVPEKNELFGNIQLGPGEVLVLELTR
jgi:hypothetical protein